METGKTLQHCSTLGKGPSDPPAMLTCGARKGEPGTRESEAEGGISRSCSIACQMVGETDEN